LTSTIFFILCKNIKLLFCTLPIGNGGVLLIVANYTGDVFNFGLACEKAKKIDNINVIYFLC